MDMTFGEKREDTPYTDRKAAYLITIQEGKLAAVNTPRGCFLLGGGIELGETPQDCLKRECLEEAGRAIRVDRLICSVEGYCQHEALGYFHPIQYYYAGEIFDQVAEPVEKDHTLVWINLNEVDKKLLLKCQAWAVRRFCDRGCVV